MHVMHARSQSHMYTHVCMYRYIHRIQITDIKIGDTFIHTHSYRYIIRSNIFMHTYIHTYIHAYIHTTKHTYTRRSYRNLHISYLSADNWLNHVHAHSCIQITDTVYLHTHTFQMQSDEPSPIVSYVTRPIHDSCSPVWNQFFAIPSVSTCMQSCMCVCMYVI